VGTPFVLGFRAVVCVASTVVAGPMAALFAVSPDPRYGFAYLRDGLAQNCGPPYGVPLPSAADRAREPAARYMPPDLGPPRRLTPYFDSHLMPWGARLPRSLARPSCCRLSPVVTSGRS
jgi:hypothetical protein